MNKEQVVSYLRFSGFSDEQIKAIEGAFSGWERSARVQELTARIVQRMRTRSAEKR